MKNSKKDIQQVIKESLKLYLRFLPRQEQEFSETEIGVYFRELKDYQAQEVLKAFNDCFPEVQITGRLPFPSELRNRIEDAGKQFLGPDRTLGKLLEDPKVVGPRNARIAGKMADLLGVYRGDEFTQRALKLIDEEFK